MSAKLPKHLDGLSKSELESMCVNCGLCCYAQVELVKGHKVLVPELRCRHLVNKSEERLAATSMMSVR